jgi:hypothetical protein
LNNIDLFEKIKSKALAQPVTLEKAPKSEADE